MADRRIFGRSFCSCVPERVTVVLYVTDSRQRDIHDAGSGQVVGAEVEGMSGSTPAAPGRIFISYRRQETAYPAAWLYERVAAHFGREQVFKDVDSIKLGDDFAQVIANAVGSCDVLLALIGDRWLTINDEDGRRRLEDPDDFVRLEIETALERDIRVIPVLFEGARLPRVGELPASLAKLVRRQALELSPSRFDADISKLLRVLDTTLAEEQARREQAAVAREAEAQAQREAEARATREAEEQARYEKLERSPKLKLSQTVVDFGSLAVNEKSPSKIVFIKNVSGGQLKPVARTAEHWISLEQSDEGLQISIDTSAPAILEGVVTVESEGGRDTIAVRAKIEQRSDTTIRPEAQPIAPLSTVSGASALNVFAQSRRTVLRIAVACIIILAAVGLFIWNANRGDSGRTLAPGSTRTFLATAPWSLKVEEKVNSCYAAVYKGTPRII